MTITAADDARPAGDLADTRPILIVPYMWIGDFVRCHSVVSTLKARWPNRPIDVLANPLPAPLLDYMPGVRKGIVSELPRKRLAAAMQFALARRLRAERYGTVLVMPRTWKAALAPFLAGIPERIGFFGEGRVGLLNDLRLGERKLLRMVDQCGALALRRDSALPPRWPVPELRVPAAETAAWKARHRVAEGRPLVAFAPGSVAPARRWMIEAYAELARLLAGQGCRVIVLGGPDEKPLAAALLAAAPGCAEDHTGGALREAIVALAAADTVVSNDSGLLHVAAAIGTPTIGIFGPTSPWLWAPLNPLAATILAPTDVPCRPCHTKTCREGHHRCMQDISAAQVFQAVRRTLPRRAATAVP